MDPAEGAPRDNFRGRVSHNDPQKTTEIVIFTAKRLEAIHETIGDKQNKRRNAEPTRRHAGRRRRRCRKGCKIPKEN